MENLGDLMKQAQSMQEKMAKIQKDLEDTTVEGIGKSLIRANAPMPQQTLMRSAPAQTIRSAPTPNSASAANSVPSLNTVPPDTVIVTMSCKYKLLDLKIAPNLIKGEHYLLEEAVKAAINDAVKKIEVKAQGQIGKIFGPLKDMIGGAGGNDDTTNDPQPSTFKPTINPA